MIALLLWWISLFLMGVGFLPLTEKIFCRFEDRGWLFSKVLGLLISMWTLWFLCVAGLVSFTNGTAVMITAVLSILTWGVKVIFTLAKGDRNPIPDGNLRLIMIEEVLFTVLFFVCVYIVGFKPEAYGTEKFMDYAFLTAMDRSTTLPFEDTWLAGTTINYYYGGQYAAAFLMKLTNSLPGYAYNMMRALVSAMSFILPFSLVYQMMADKIKCRGESVISGYPMAAGLLGGGAVALAGNGHFLIYGLIKPVIGLFTGETSSYWFPNSTRFIGYNPETADKTIHEFPSYSSVLGDLHAHYVNLLFVLTVMAVVYAWGQKQERKQSSIKSVFCSEVILIGFLTGIFRWTNAADFAIYFVVCGSILFFTDLRIYSRHIGMFFLTIICQAAEVLAVGALAALPFTASFQSFTNGYGLTHSHSALWQLAVLWGLPILVLIFYVLRLVIERQLDFPDMAALLFGLCAAGLVMLPEVVYVKDIYGDGFYRANTMFKLTYQAFVLFAVMMAYVLVRALLVRNHGGFLAVVGKIPAVAGIFLLILTIAYTPVSINSWFGNILDPAKRETTDASAFIYTDFASDAGAIDWLIEHVDGRAVVLEAMGDSYSDCGRISVATGLPTVCGWYVHEWLWRNSSTVPAERKRDITDIYTAVDPEEARTLLKKYDISYICVGDLERRTYAGISEELLKSLGTVVYEGTGDETYIIKVQ